MSILFERHFTQAKTCKSIKHPNLEKKKTYSESRQLQWLSHSVKQQNFHTSKSRIKVFHSGSLVLKHPYKVIYGHTCPWPIWRTDLGVLSRDVPAYSWVTLHKPDMNAVALRHLLARWVWVQEIYRTWKRGHAVCLDRLSHRVKPSSPGPFFFCRLCNRYPSIFMKPVDTCSKPYNRNIPVPPCWTLRSSNSSNV